MPSLKLIFLGVAAGILAIVSSPVSARPQPVPNYGNGCPFGYYSDGNFCSPFSSNNKRTPLLRGGGGCPFGYYSDGDYCSSFD